VLEKLQHAVAANPADDNARFDYVKLLLQLGREDDAKVAFAPVIAQTTVVRRFDSLKRWMDAMDFVATRQDAGGGRPLMPGLRPTSAISKPALTRPAG
jgi:putative thioredoxin